MAQNGTLVSPSFVWLGWVGLGFGEFVGLTTEFGTSKSQPLLVTGTGIPSAPWYKGINTVCMLTVSLNGSYVKGQSCNKDIHIL